MMVWSSWVLPILLGTALAADPWAPEDRAAPTSDAAPVVGGSSTQRHCFPSGLQVFGERAPSGGVVLVGTVVGSGSAAELPDEYGLAHLVEHLWFRSKHGGAGWLSSVQRDEGLWWNAHTTRDLTTYLVGGRKDQIEELLRREAMRLANPLDGVDEATFAVERAIVQSERRQSYEQHGWAAADALFAALYPPDHSYAHTVIGSDRSLAGLSLQQAQSFVQRDYRPDNASVHVVGEVMLGALPGLVQASFPPELLWARDGGPTAPVRCPQVSEPSRVEPPLPVDRGPKMISAPVVVPYAMAAWTLPEGGTPDAAMGRSVAAVVELSIEGRIKRSVGCSFWDQSQGSMLVCATDLDGAVFPRRTAQRMVKAGARVWQDPRWNWTKTYQNMRWILSADLLHDSDERWMAGSSLSFDRMEWAHLTGNADYVGSLYGLIATPTRAQAQAYTDRWITKHRGTSVVVAPDARGGTQPSAILAVAEAAATPAHSSLDIPESVPVAAPTAAQLMDLAALPGPDALTRSTLANGVELVVLPGGPGGRVQVELVVPVTAATAEDRNTAAMVTRHLHTTAGDLNGRSFYRAPWYVGGFWLTALRDDSLSIGVTGSAPQLENLLYMVRRRVEQARIHQGGRGRALRSDRRWAKDLARLPEVRADRVRWAQLLGTRADNTDLTLQDVELRGGVSRSDARQWLAAHLQPDVATLIVTGAVDPARVRTLADLWMADWEGQAKTSGWSASAAPELPPLLQRTHTRVHQSSTSQARVELSCRLDSPDGRVSPAHELVAEWLGATLFEEIRAARGLAYSPRAWLDAEGDQVLLELEIMVDRGGARIALDVIDDALDQLVDGLPSDDIHRTQRALAASRRHDLRSAGALASQLRAQAEGRSDWAQLQAWPAALAAVDATLISQTVGTCVGHEAITVTGPDQDLSVELPDFRLLR